MHRKKSINHRYAVNISESLTLELIFSGRHTHIIRVYLVFWRRQGGNGNAYHFAVLHNIRR